jgi:hypothetical protein
MLELRPGLELAPLSVGTGGAWQVSAAGVRTVHLYVYFDGQTLFLQSAAPDDPPLMDGQPVPAAWTPAPAPCNITFGHARLAFHAAEAEQPVEEDRTVASAVAEPFHEPQKAPAPLPKRDIPARPFKPGAFAHGADDESTRLQPLEDFTGPPVSGDSTRVAPLPTAENPGGGGVRPAAGAPWNRPAPPPAMGAPPPAQGGGFQSRQFPPPPSAPLGPPSDPTGGAPLGPPGPAGPPSGLLNVPPPSVRAPDAPEKFPDMLKREWAAAPPLRRGLVAALPIAVIVALWLLLSGSPPPPPPKTVASAAPTTPPAPPPPPVPTVAQVPTVWPPVEPPPPVPPPPPPVAGAHPAPPAGGTATPAPSASVASSATVDGGTGDRRERQAGDLVATHAYAEAIRVYEQLAAEHPQNPAFHEAARILRNKVQNGTP